jgi:hypothetical protein
MNNRTFHPCLSSSFGFRSTSFRRIGDSNPTNEQGQIPFPAALAGKRPHHPLVCGKHTLDGLYLLRDGGNLLGKGGNLLGNVENLIRNEENISRN